MTKQIFDMPPQPTNETFRPKQTFENVEVFEDEPLQGEVLENAMDEAVSPKSSRLGRWAAGLFGLLGVATLAQLVQWVYDAIINQQWIYLAFSVVGLGLALLGVIEVGRELRRLAVLKKRGELRNQSKVLLESQAENLDAKALCLDIAKNLHLNADSPEVSQWQSQLNEAYTPAEITQLFGQKVLPQFDRRAQKLVAKMAAESAVIVAISPLAIVDMLFIAWRGIRLINRIAQIYGIELGYFTRIRLLRLVLVNMAFAGATELVQDWGMDWLSQDLTGKVSARVAQGLGVGILTARLGIKAMEFCRPLAFTKEDKPKLKHIQKELLTTLKATVLGKKAPQETAALFNDEK